MSICDPFRFQSSYYKQCYEGTRLILNKAAAGFSSSFPQPRAARWDPAGAKPCRGARTPPELRPWVLGAGGIPQAAARGRGRGRGCPRPPSSFQHAHRSTPRAPLPKPVKLQSAWKRKKKKKSHQLGFVFPMISFNWISALCLLYFILGFIGFNYKSIVICYVALV